VPSRLKRVTADGPYIARVAGAADVRWFVNQPAFGSLGGQLDGQDGSRERFLIGRTDHRAPAVAPNTIAARRKIAAAHSKRSSHVSQCGSENEAAPDLDRGVAD
jgi:hypothetical protein